MRLLSDTFPPNRRAEKATEYEQFDKVREEYAEWVNAVVHGGDKLEEALDMLIALDGWLDKQPLLDVGDALTKVLLKGHERGDWDLSTFRPCGTLTRCRDCKFLGRETIVAGEYRCNRTERIVTLDDYCSRAVRRDG